MIEINEKIFLNLETTLFKKFKNTNKITNAIIKTRSTTLIAKSIKRSSNRKKIARKKINNFKNVSFINFEISKKNLFEKFLNIVFINVAIFQNLYNSRKRKNDYKIFSLFMKKNFEILKSSKTTRNDNLKNLKIHIVIEIITKILKQKIFKFFHKFKNVLNLKKIENLSFYRVYNHKIEFIDENFALSKNKIYFLSFKKFETLQKNFIKNLKKKFINLNNAFFASFILFVVKSNEQLKLCVDYQKFNVITKRNIYSILLIEKILIRVIDCKYIFKLDIISIFNKFRMKINNENFITFICFLNIYKYHVFFFRFNQRTRQLTTLHERFVV